MSCFRRWTAWTFPRAREPPKSLGSHSRTSGSRRASAGNHRAIVRVLECASMVSKVQCPTNPGELKPLCYPVAWGAVARRLVPTTWPCAKSSPQKRRPTCNFRFDFFNHPGPVRRGRVHKCSDRQIPKGNPHIAPARFRRLLSGGEKEHALNVESQKKIILCLVNQYSASPSRATWPMKLSIG